MSVDVEGTGTIIAELDKAISIDTLEQRMKKACALVVRVAAHDIPAPKDTGALRRSLTFKTLVEGNNVTGIVFTPLEYAPYVEYGTGLFAEKGGRKDAWTYQDDAGNWHTTNGQKPQPFLRPALAQSRTDIARILKGENKNG